MVRAIADRSSPRLTEQLRQAARGSQWPEEAVKAVSVRQIDGDLEIHVDPAAEYLVNEYEYGTATRPPTAVIRNFTARIPTLIQDIILAEFSTGVRGMLNEL